MKIDDVQKCKKLENYGKWGNKWTLWGVIENKEVLTGGKKVKNKMTMFMGVSNEINGYSER